MATEWDNWIGREAVQHDVLTSALLARFRATFNSDATDNIAPQGILMRLCTPEAATAQLGIDGHPVRGDFLPPVTLPRRMWASSALVFHNLIKVGAAIKRRSTIANVTEKRGGSGLLVFVQVDHETYADGVLAVHERQTLVYRDAPPRADPKSPEISQQTMQAAPKDLALDWDWHDTITPSAPLLFRYSALTFNSHRIHYDAPYVTQEEGYPGLVVHGPLTATLLLGLVAREYGGNKLKSFSFRGQSPAFVDKPIHLVGRATGSALALAALGEDGRTLMSAEAELGESDV